MKGLWFLMKGLWFLMYNSRVRPLRVRKKNGLFPGDDFPIRVAILIESAVGFRERFPSRVRFPNRPIFWEDVSTNGSVPTIC
jgi:hypothetical protein